MATAQINGNPSSFSLSSSWHCTGSPNTDGYYTSFSTPTVATKDVTFDISSIPKNATITKAYIYAKWSSPAYGFNARNINGTVAPRDGNTNITITSAQLSAGSVTATFKFSSATSAQKTTATKTGTTNVSGVYLYAEYTVPYTSPTAPTSVTISPTNVAPGGSATLSWSGASAGNNNPISGYDIYSCDGDPNGTYSYYKHVKITSNSGSDTVFGPTTNNAVRYFKVITLGSVSDYPWSTFSSSYASLTCKYSAPSAPTSCSVSETISNSNATLSWSGATNGNNNTITGYEIQRCESSDGTSWGSWVALTTTTSTSLSVEPSSTYGNYYKYRVRTQGSFGSSDCSGWKESTNSLRRDHAPLDAFTDPVLTAGVTPIKAIHMQEMQDRVETLRAFYGLSAYSFSTVTAGQTSLAGWTEHVNEIRSAVDGIGKAHDSWVEIGQNVPTVAVMQQLRDIILAI